jgi:hypothetical protein
VPDALLAVLLPAFAAGVVAVLATVAVERLGGARGGVLSSIPTTIVPAALGIWGDGTDPEGFRRAMHFVPVGILLNAGYLLLWRVVPGRLGMIVHRHLLAWTVIVALGAWLAAATSVAALERMAAPSAGQARVAGFAAALAGLALAIAANRVRHPAPAGSRRVGVPVLLARGAAAAAAIGCALLLARAGLPVASGIASVFPAIFTTVMVATWIAQGPRVPTGAVGPMMLGTLSVTAYALLAAWLFPLIPAGWAAAACWVAATGCVSVPAYAWLSARATSGSTPATPR